MTARRRGSNKLYGGYYKQAPVQTTGMYINEELLRYFKVMSALAEMSAGNIKIAIKGFP